MTQISEPLIGSTLTYEQKIFLARRIDQVDLSVRSANCLIDANIKRLGDLVQMMPGQLLRIRNFGQGCLNEINLLMADANLSLGLKLEGWNKVTGWLDPNLTYEGNSPSTGGSPNLTRDQMAFLVLRLTPRSFSTKVRKFIEAKKLKRVGDLAIMRPHYLYNKLGMKAVNEVKKFLADGDIDIILGTSIENWDEQHARTWEAELIGESDRLREQLTIDPHFLRKDIRLIEDELQEIARLAFGSSKSRDAQIVTRLFGFDGSGKKTLEQVGGEFGLTRERIRQVSDNFRQRLHERSVNSPLLMRAHELILEQAPNLNDKIEATLRDDALTAVDFNCSGIAAALMQFGINPKFDVVRISNELVVGETSVLKPLSQATEAAKLLAGSLGCVHVDHVASKLMLAPSRSLGDCLGALLERTCRIKWLDQDHVWFAISEVKRRPLATVISKVLSVSATIKVAELHSALQRVHRLQIVPPQEVLIEFCKTLKFVHVEGEHIKAGPQLSIDANLGETERCFYEVLRRSGPAMHVDQIRDDCSRRGMNKHTFDQYLKYSPIVRELGSKMYSLVGADVPTEIVRRLHPTQSKISDFD